MVITNSLSRPPREQGFTLLELLITVVIAGVLAAIALPNMSVFIQNNARTTRMNLLTTALNIARNEAVAKQITTTVCASTTLPAPVNYTCNGTNAFAGGWIVMTDTNADAVINGTDQVLRVFEPNMSGADSLTGWTATRGQVSRISFNNSGQPTGFNPPLTGVYFTYCDARGANLARAVILTRAGHTKTSRDVNGDGIHEVRGVNITLCP